MKPRPVTVYDDSGNAHYTGMFIGWGVDGMGISDRYLHRTVAIIGKDTGSVELIPMDRFMFNEPTPNEL